MLLDVVDGLAYSRNLLGCVIGNLDIELLLELHNQLYCIEGVST